MRAHSFSATDLSEISKIFERFVNQMADGNVPKDFVLRLVEVGHARSSKNPMRQAKHYVHIEDPRINENKGTEEFVALCYTLFETETRTLDELNTFVDNVYFLKHFKSNP